MTARIRPAILALAMVTTLLAALFLVFNQPARAVPVTPTESTVSTAVVTPATVCTTTGVCLLDESTPFTVTRPSAVLPAETPATVCAVDACVLDESTPFSVVRPPLPAETPATICTPGACVIDESTPFSVVR